MRRHIHNLRDIVLPVIDVFYPPFKSVMNLQTFRYAVSGGFNTLLSIVLYFIAFHYVLHEKPLHMGFYAMKAHTGALFLSFLITFPIGFFLAKYVVFSDSQMKGRVQIFRYLLVCLSNLILNYFFLKFFVEVAHIYPTIAQVITTAFIILFSYMAQRHFSFKASKGEETAVD